MNAVPPGQGLLGQRGPAQEEMEEAAVLQDPAQELFFRGSFSSASRPRSRFP